jgi:hypothetical protein
MSTSKKRPNYIPTQRGEEKSIQDQLELDQEPRDEDEPTLDDLLDTSSPTTVGPVDVDKKCLGNPTLSLDIKGSLTFKQTMQLGAFSLAMESTIQKFMTPGGLRRKKELVKVFVQDALYLAEIVGEAYDEVRGN